MLTYRTMFCVCWVFDTISIYLSHNLEKKTVQDYVQIKTFIIPLSFHLHPTSLSCSSHQGFGVTWASLGLSLIVGLSGYGTANRKKL